MAAASKVSLKLLIDRRGKRVLFAESSKDFVDFLFNILSLPVGTVIRLLSKEGMVGCLGNLYDSLENLDDDYIQPNQKRDTLLKPNVTPTFTTQISLLSLQGAQTTPKTTYSCTNCRRYVAEDFPALCPCGYKMSSQVTNLGPQASVDKAASDKGGFVKGVVTYMIMDDLVVKPMSTISSITLLNKFNIKDVGDLEEKTVDLGMDEGLKLLEASLKGKTILTSLFLKELGP